MRISVIGCGYLGAVHAACMAGLGHEVVGIEVDARRRRALAAGRAPFHEPGLDSLLAREVRRRRLRFVEDAAMADLDAVDVHFLCVGTPQGDPEGSADLSHLDRAVEALAKVLRPGRRTLVVGKSTVPVGTARRLAQRLAPTGAVLMWNPEFLREGFAIEDTLHPDRIVYGLPEHQDCAEYAKQLLDSVYAPLLGEGIPRLLTDLETAELIKVAANSFLATKISFINAMAEVCEAAGADVTVLADAIGRDSRIGNLFLRAGVGFGGGCLPKDIRAFRARAHELGVGDALDFLEDVEAINLRRRQKVVDLVREKVPGGIVGAKVCVLGAAFKPDSDDIRDSPAVDVALRLHEAGAHVSVNDPKALPTLAREVTGLDLEEDLETALAEADVVVLLTEWEHFVALDPWRVAELVSTPLVIDGRNALPRARWVDAGWEHVGLGRAGVQTVLKA
ncbi:UDP-glucose/GDP-mannose dehydrogenase family protein [Schaalia sp. 19OD2882]|uniref:UDP-glucose dehydrogenase family protein n=1 Tax=Schaalia sp. 19OD2882 TaxID=2794089 RepID=UPI001C1EDA0F|nr:UDP-glucose/GDP-mannose dehydrogenase family protein [Schaalia sp. 19OD2882]QWW19003.1 UDP-glucose/GDP-mannose dehydrogenase family protein [Schaalia sp. 19OD2882]